MSSIEPDSVAPISAPSAGLDPRTIHQADTPAPDAHPGIRDLGPSPGTYRDPVTHGGLHPMSATDSTPDSPLQTPTAPLTGPDPRIEAPTTPLTGLDPRTSHEMPAPDAPTDVRDRNPAPGTNPDPGFNSHGIGIRPRSAGSGPDIGPMQASGDDNGYGVSNAELSRLADELDEAAAILEKADKGLAESDSAARTHGMLTSGRMLKKTTGDWDDEITRLAKQCRSLAGKMRQTHTNYTAQEHRTGRDFQAILASLEGDA
ncbi:type VII secretion target [Streptomyces sp. T-3]|nr:type VII secretion target [Streptomyces sp. T-3]